MSDPTKPHKGQIKNWFRSETEGFGLGYRIRGEFVDHPDFGNAPNGVTSYVVAHDEATGEIETRNSRYTLVGPERGVAKLASNGILA